MTCKGYKEHLIPAAQLVAFAIDFESNMNNLNSKCGNGGVVGQHTHKEDDQAAMKGDTMVPEKVNTSRALVSQRRDPESQGWAA